MTIDEAIKHCEEVAWCCEEQAEQCDSDDRYERHVMHENAECAADHRQLAEWLRELKEAKRLLKAAVEDIHNVLTSQIKITNYTLCEKCKYYLNCNCKDKCLARHDLKQWRYADEALALIGNGGDNIHQDRCSNYMDCDGSCFIDDTPCKYGGDIEKCVRGDSK